jgi:general secretion pathway protein F/type IV pilus assembly protein PilC
MAEFHYLACDPQGRQLHGAISAGSRREALITLNQRSLTTLQLVAGSTPNAASKTRWGATQYGQLADLLRTGVPMLQAMEVLRQQASQPSSKALMQQMMEQLADGSSLSQAMRSAGDAFDPIAIGVVAAGEEGGFLEDSLVRIGQLCRKQDELKQRIAGAMIYPSLLAVAGALIVLALLIYFVPSFQPIFEGMAQRSQLPWATTVLIGASDLIRQWGVSIGLIALIALGSLASSKSPRRLWTLGLEAIAPMPGLGVLIREGVAERFCRILGTLLGNHVPMVRALEIARQTIGLPAFANHLSQVSRDVADGSSLSHQLRRHPFFPADIGAMLAVGEQSNTLAGVLVEAADILERRNARRIEVLLKLMEPFLLIGLAAIVLFLVIGLMLPILDASGSIRN